MEASWPERAKLRQEAQIVLEEEPQVVHSVAQHREPIDAGAEGITGVALGVDATRFEHVWVDHAAAGDLEPAGVLAGAASLAGTEEALHVDFGRRFREGEVRGPKAHREVSLEEGLQEPMQYRLHVGEADVLPHHESLELVKHRRVRHVRVAAVDASRSNDGEWRTAVEERPDLHRGGVGAQQPPVREVEGIMEGARRMILRDIERGEIVEVVLDLRPRGNVEPGATEQGLDAQPRARHRVQSSRLLSPARKGHVDATLVKLALDVCALELRATRLECALQLLLRLVDARTGRRPLAGRDRAERLQLLGEGSLLAEPAHACLFERAGIGAGGDFLERLLEKGREVQRPSLNSCRGRSLPAERWRRRPRYRARRYPPALCGRSAPRPCSVH